MCHFFLFPEAAGDVGGFPVDVVVKPLVGGAGTETSEICLITTNFHVIK